MIYILLSLLVLFIILLTIWLIRYHLALVNLSQQIEDKILTGSMKRIGVSTFSKDFLHLYQQINHLFAVILFLRIKRFINGRCDLTYLELIHLSISFHYLKHIKASQPSHVNNDSVSLYHRPVIPSTLKNTIYCVLF